MPEDDSRHLTEATMQRFLQGTLSDEDTTALMRHLLSQCTDCLEVALATGADEGFIVGSDGDFRPERVPEGVEYREAFLAVLRSGEEQPMRLAQEKLRAIGLFAALEELPPDKRLSAIRTQKRFQTWGLFDRLLAKYPEYSRHNPQDGVNLVTLALAVVESLEDFRPALLADFHAQALGALCNAKRLAADFDGAKAALRSAWEMLREGTGEPLEDAHLVSLEASLLRDLGKLEESAALLNKALSIYESAGDTGRQARTLIKQANAIGYIEPTQAVPLLQSALALLGAAEEPRLELCARHNLIWFLNDAGQHREALALLEISRPLYSAFADPWTQLRLHWLEGRIARALGDIAEAEATFRLVWYDFEARGMLYELTLVSIDLAEVYSARRRYKRAMRMAQDLLPVLERWGMHAEGRAVWMLFRDTLAKQAREKLALNAAAFTQAAQYYHRAWFRPLETSKP
jgi:tetratricopeptide (TPR) repeat protein